MSCSVGRPGNEEIPGLLVLAAFALLGAAPAGAGASTDGLGHGYDVGPGVRNSDSAGRAIRLVLGFTPGSLAAHTPSVVEYIYDSSFNFVAPSGIVDAGKYDYLFGNVSSNSHNLNRSLQNQRQLNRVGVYDNAAGRELLSSHFDEVLSTDSNILRTFTDEWGTSQVRESVFAGPNGVLKFETTWQVTDDGLRLTTVIPFGGG